MSTTPPPETTTIAAELTAATVREGRPTAVEVPLGKRGESIDRYTILEVLGKGGMGVVYKAYDPDLDRRIALKVVRPGRRGSAQIELRDRLLREAQALAQLAHPNVVAVHDVGTFENDVFLAMELVEGQTLKAWLRAEPRSRREIIAVFAAAGEGLAAAHAQGMVHRDVKPSNVIVGDDGRVRVVDFGLARPAGATGESGSVTPQPLSDDTTGSFSSSRDRLLSTPLTRAGHILGTPGYMAPEQYRMEEVDAQSDQYAFCVSLYEALVGQRPFRAKEVAELKEKVIAGEPDDPDELKQLPAHLARLLRRGLSVERGQRYPSMAALLTDLRYDPAARRRRIAGIAGIAVLLATAGVLATSMRGHRPTCTGLDKEVHAVWNDGARAQIETAFRATGRSYAGSMATRVNAYLDSYADALAAARVQACRATRVEGTQSDALLDRRMVCLEHRRRRLATVVRLLGNADGDVLDHSLEAVQALPRLDPCADARALLHEAPPSPAAADIQGTVDHALALQSVGRFPQARTVAQEAVTRANALGEPALEASALSALSVARLDVDPAGSEKALQEALDDATDAGNDRILAGLWIDLMDVIAEHESHFEAALSLSRPAELAVRRAGNDPLLRARLSSIEGAILSETNQLDESRRLLLEALETQEKRLPDGAADIIETLGRLATTEKLMGRYDDSFGRLERIRAIRERTLGKAHPRYGTALYNLGVHMLARGEANKAIHYFEQALDVLQAALGKNHVMVATTLSSLGSLLATIDGRSEEGKKMLERALEIETRTVGADDPLVAAALQALGDLATRQSHYDKARTLLERALAIRQRSLPENHPKIGESLAALAGLMWDQGKYAESRAYYDRTRAIYQKAYGRDHPFYAVMLLNVGDCDLELGQVDEAVRSFEQAVAALESSDGSPARLADARFALARALWRAGRERKRARSLAKAALDGYIKAGDYYADAKHHVETWLRKPSSR